MVALIVLVIVFGAVVAGVTPIIMAIFAIAVTLGIVGLIGQVWRFSFFAPNLITMMGLAVGIDYSLFIVSRYREERQRGREKLDAVGAAGATANRAVFFSGMMVVARARRHADRPDDDLPVASPAGRSSWCSSPSRRR